MTPHRVALYWTPPDESPLSEFAARWLGRDTLGRWVPPLRLGFDPAAWEAMTEAPRRYGFHATLKAPFRLAEGVGLPEIEQATDALAKELTAPSLRLAIQNIGSFLALCPINPPNVLATLAGRCVEVLEPFRAQLTPEEVAKRGPKLSPRQNEYLHQWGYPYVFEEFRLHLTLTGSLSEPARSDALERLHHAITPLLTREVRLADLCLFVEPSVNSPLILYRRYPIIRGRDWGGIGLV